MTVLLNRAAGAAALITDPGKLADHAACMRGCGVLEKHYPGHVWSVTVDQAVMQIRAGAFRGPYAYVIKVNDWLESDLDREIVRAGGELLERHGIGRQERSESTYDPFWFGHIKQVKPNA